jgi:hypothetical protein
MKQRHSISEPRKPGAFEKTPQKSLMARLAICKKPSGQEPL